MTPLSYPLSQWGVRAPRRLGDPAADQRRASDRASSSAEHSPTIHTPPVVAENTTFCQTTCTSNSTSVTLHRKALVRQMNFRVSSKQNKEQKYETSLHALGECCKNEACIPRHAPEKRAVSVTVWCHFSWVHTAQSWEHWTPLLNSDGAV